MSSGQLHQAKNAVTSTNALHYAFRTAANPETRLLLLLHGVAWMGRFRESMKGGGFRPVKITELPEESVSDDDAKAAAEVLELIGPETPTAAAKALRLPKNIPNRKRITRWPGGSSFAKGTTPIITNTRLPFLKISASFRPVAAPRAGDVGLLPPRLPRPRFKTDESSRRGRQSGVTPEPR